MNRPLNTRWTMDADPREAGEEQERAWAPRAPQTVEETGLNFLFILELVAKILFNSGQLRLAELAGRTRLAIGVLEPLLAFMRTERICEVSRRGETETDVTYALTELGRLRAEDCLQKSRYAGPAPVTLADYVRQVDLQSVSGMHVSRERMGAAFAQFVIKDRLLEQFGAAMNSNRAMFLYGPAGSGKTYLAEQLVKVLCGHVYIPHAIMVDDEVIQVFDPLVHKEVAAQCVPGSILERRKSRDQRWVLCQRPVVIAGGELTLSMLDVEYDERARFYHMPPQVKANNGLLIIDDLGRQLVPAHQLMNRWIVPLDRHVDYLALNTGKKFMIPFDVKVVFATNISPEELDDEAFLRRLGYKIFVGPLDPGEYRRVFLQVCEELQIPYSEHGFAYLLHEHHEKEGKPLLACLPRDLLGQVKDHGIYGGVRPELSEDLLDWAWTNYFANEWQGRRTSALMTLNA